MYFISTMSTHIAAGLYVMNYTFNEMIRIRVLRVSAAFQRLVKSNLYY